jgi:phage FluMu gp28-like protein
MSFFSIFGIGSAPSLKSTQVPQAPSLKSTQVCSSAPGPETRADLTKLESTGADLSQTPSPQEIWCLPTQAAWLNDPWPLRIWEKSRQVGATKTDALDSVLKASPGDAQFDVWVSSRDELQACLYLEDCKQWAKVLHLAAEYKGRVVLDRKTNSSAFALQFANGRTIYCLSSNPNAFAGKRGHVKLDEFALHPDQRLLFSTAKPVTQWGGTMSIISTHRGPGTVFNQIIQDTRRDPAKSPWHLYSYPLQKAISEGLVERIAECIDEDQWNQEYCCIAADQNAAFISYDLLAACEDASLKLLTPTELIEYATRNTQHAGSTTLPRSDAPTLYVGVDVARSKNLCVIDVGEKIGDVIWDRCRIELHNRPFAEIEANLFPILRLSQVKRACLDSSPIGTHLFERAKEIAGWKVEGVNFTAHVKEQLAFNLRAAFEDRKLRIVRDDKLRADLRALRKEVTPSGNIRLDGQADDSHCDRFWAKALRQEAARQRFSAGGLVC